MIAAAVPAFGKYAAVIPGANKEKGPANLATVWFT
jgi:hypothetical protein